MTHKCNLLKRKRAIKLYNVYICVCVYIYIYIYTLLMSFSTNGKRAGLANSIYLLVICRYFVLSKTQHILHAHTCVIGIHYQCKTYIVFSLCYYSRLFRALNLKGLRQCYKMLEIDCKCRRILVLCYTVSFTNIIFVCENVRHSGESATCPWSLKLPLQKKKTVTRRMRKYLKNNI